MPRRKKEEVLEHVMAGKEPEPKVEAKEEKEISPFDKVKITIPVHLKLQNRHLRPGTHIVERHQVDTILEMVNKKQRANLAIFTGNNYLVEKMVDGALKVTQVAELDSKTLVGG